MVTKRQSWKLGYLASAGLMLFAAVTLHEKEPALSVLLGVLGVYALAYLFTSMATVFHFDDEKVRRVRFGREHIVRYRDVARMNLEIIRHYHARTHTHSDYQLRLDGLRAFFRVSPSEAELPTVLDKIADAVADKLDLAGDVKWGQTATLTGRGVESFCTPRLLQKPQAIRLPYEQISAIGFDVGGITSQNSAYSARHNIGYRQLQLRGASADEVVRLHCGEDNFYPGYRVLLRRLGARMRSFAPAGSSLSP
jgi:hypothetical protein